MNNLNKSWYLYVPTILLFIAILNLPYGYYEMLRIVITVYAAFFAFKLSAAKQNGLMLIMIAILILFNPISPMHLDKGLWMLLDIVSAVIFLVSLSRLSDSDLKKE